MSSFKTTNGYVFLFALCICVTCALLISFTATSLKDRQDFNIKIDIQKNILAAVGLPEDKTQILTQSEVADMYKEYIVGEVIDRQGNTVDKTVAELLAEKKPKDLVLYKRRSQPGADDMVAVAIPVIGKGLWSTLYGYLALESDFNTVRGITFYRHGETPGLGAEIEKDWFTRNFVDKKVLDKEGNIASITVIKGKVDELISDPEQRSHSVDGISGATMTTKGVNELIRRGLETYEPYFKKHRGRPHAAAL